MKTLTTLSWYYSVIIIIIKLKLIKYFISNSFFFFFLHKEQAVARGGWFVCWTVKLKSTIRISSTIRKLRKLKFIKKKNSHGFDQMYIYHYRGIHIIFKILTSLQEEKEENKPELHVYMSFTWHGQFLWNVHCNPFQTSLDWVNRIPARIIRVWFVVTRTRQADNSTSN